MLMQELLKSIFFRINTFKKGRFILNLRYINEEQRHQIELHKYLTSEKAGKDRAEEACLEWVKNFAPSFRKWAETIPENCVKCGYCGCNSMNAIDECHDPFNPDRINKIDKENLYKKLPR